MCDMMSGEKSKFPLTATQWQELEQQALVYKYMVSGLPVPPHLLHSIRTSMDSSSLSSSKLFLQPPQHFGWNHFQMGFGKKIDPEPGRCKRTDGKKWRCSKEAYPDSKYCERHMHRGRNRSRKPVEIAAKTTSTTTTISLSSSINKTTNIDSCISPSSCYPHSSSSRTRDHTTGFLMDSRAYSRNGYGNGMEEEALRATMKSNTLDSLGQRLKQHRTTSVVTQQFDECKNVEDMHTSLIDLSPDDHHRAKKVMHHFFDEWPRAIKKNSWLDDDNDDGDSGDKYSSSSQISLFKTNLSISIPNPSPRDFFLTHNGK